MTFDLVLVGFGNVARRFVSLLDEQQETLAREHDLRTRIVGITTRRHGQRYAARGLDASALARAIERGESVGHEKASSVAFIRRSTGQSAVAARQRRLVVIEATTLDIRRGEPAIAHVRAALAGGAHVVTANKGPAAFAYRSLARAASKARRRFLFEGAVMDGIPIFNLVRDTLPAVTVTGFRGVVNSTTNYVLTAMEQGETFERALARMQVAGIAEAEPSLDVLGWDAAAKTAALANVLLDANLTPHDVARQPLSAAMGRQAIAAVAAGRRLKLVAEARRDGRRVIARVASVELPAHDLLAGLEGQQNAIVLTTDLLQEVAIVQRGGGLTHTAYALLSDLITIGRDVSRNGGGR